MPKYKVIFKAGEREMDFIITAKSAAEAVGAASKLFKVGVIEIGKLITSDQFK